MGVHRMECIMKFRCEVSKRLASFAIALAMLAGPPLALARDDEKKTEPAKSETTKKVDPLKEKENPLMIGKRDINKGNLDFYSFDKEAALGRSLSSEIDSHSKFITDPV